MTKNKRGGSLTQIQKAPFLEVFMNKTLQISNLKMPHIWELALQNAYLYCLDGLDTDEYCK